MHTAFGKRDGEKECSVSSVQNDALNKLARTVARILSVKVEWRGSQEPSL